MKPEELRRKAEELVKMSTDHLGEYTHDEGLTWLDREGEQVLDFLCDDNEARYITRCCNLAPKLADYLISHKPASLEESIELAALRRIVDQIAGEAAFTGLPESLQEEIYRLQDSRCTG